MLELLVEGASRVGTVVHGETDNLQALVAIFLLQFDEMRRLDTAGLAPTRPKVEKNHFAAIRRQAKILSV